MSILPQVFPVILKNMSAESSNFVEYGSLSLLSTLWEVIGASN